MREPSEERKEDVRWLLVRKTCHVIIWGRRQEKKGRIDKSGAPKVFVEIGSLSLKKIFCDES